MNGCIQYYGLSENPFGISSDPKFFFSSETHKEALASLIYVIKERKGFMLLVGEDGTGKTFLVNHLINSLDDNVNVVYFPQGNLSYEQILKELLLKLKLSPKRINKAAMLFELNEYLIQNLALGKNLILIIDEAQDLSEDVLEELRLTSNLETSTSKLLQIIFVGRPKLEAKLNTKGLRQLKQRIGTIGRITRLSRAKSMEYIHHRLVNAGCQSTDIFSSKAISLISKYSEGIPEKINLLCHNALIKGFERSEKPVSAKTVKKIHHKGYLLKEKQAKDAVTEHKQKSGFIFAKPNVWFRRSLYICLSVACIMVAVFIGKKYLKNIPEIPKPPIAYLQPTAVSKKVTKKVKINTPVTQEVIADIPVDREAITDIQADGEAIADAPVSEEVIPWLPVVEEVSAPESIQVESLTENQPELQNASETSENSDTVASFNAYDIPVTSDIPDTEDKNETDTETKLLRHEKIINVNEGDTLYLLIQNNYNLANATLMDIVIAFNPEIPNPDIIFVNSKIRMPEITESDLIEKSSDGSIRAHLGTFFTRRKALAYKDSIGITNKEIEIIPKTLSTGTVLLRVMAGPFTNEEESIKMLQELRQRGLLPAFGKISD